MFSDLTDGGVAALGSLIYEGKRKRSRGSECQSSGLAEPRPGAPQSTGKLPILGNLPEGVKKTHFTPSAQCAHWAPPS